MFEEDKHFLFLELLKFNEFLSIVDIKFKN